MKTLLITLLFALPLMAQSSFKSEKGNLVWEYIFPVENADVSSIMDEKKVKITSFMDNMYTGNITDIESLAEGGSGLTKCNTKFDFVIMVNPDSYVVRVKNIKYYEKMGPMQTRTVINPVENYYVYNNNVKSDERTVNDLAALEGFFSSVFSKGVTSSQPIAAKESSTVNKAKSSKKTVNKTMASNTKKAVAPTSKAITSNK